LPSIESEIALGDYGTLEIYQAVNAVDTLDETGTDGLWLDDSERIARVRAGVW